jgi:hypothetical protein
MALLGSAALAMWWDMAPELRAEFEDWHSHEHFPERLRIPGFLRATRWQSAEGGEGFFVLYDLAGYEVLTSAAYRERLDNPTPWSLRMMPRHRNMVRSQCRVLESQGSAATGHLATLRLSPRPGREEALRAALRGRLAEAAISPGLAGGHLLRTDTPSAPPTEEQRLRGGQDAAADWILLLAGYDPAALRRATAGAFGAPALAAAGAADDRVVSHVQLRHTATTADLPAPPGAAMP